MNTHSEERLKLVYPRLSDLIHKLAEQLSNEGIEIEVIQGFRTIAEQQALYEQGRTKPGHIVTNAAGGHSWHNFGLAVDCVVENLDGSIDWNDSHPAWKRMEEVGVSLGLVSGANWKRIVDAPHFQLTGPFPENAPTDTVRGLYESGGLQNIWGVVEVSYSNDLEPLKPIFPAKEQEKENV